MCKKACFLHFKCKYLTTYVVKVFEISAIHSYTSLVQDPLVRYVKKMKILKALHLAIEMTVLSGF